MVNKRFFIHVYIYYLFELLQFSKLEQMTSSKNLIEQTRSLINRLNNQQTVITNQLKTISNENPGILKRSKSVTFLDDESQPRSILKKQDDICPLEPFVVNIPDNISRIDIDQYLKDVQDQRRKGLNYSYNNEDEDEDDYEEEQQQQKQETAQKKHEPWNEVIRFYFYFELIYLFRVVI